MDAHEDVAERDRRADVFAAEHDARAAAERSDGGDGGEHQGRLDDAPLGLLVVVRRGVRRVEVLEDRARRRVHVTASGDDDVDDALDVRGGDALHIPAVERARGDGTDGAEATRRERGGTEIAKDANDAALHGDELRGLDRLGDGGLEVRECDQVAAAEGDRADGVGGRRLHDDERRRDELGGDDDAAEGDDARRAGRPARADDGDSGAAVDRAARGERRERLHRRGRPERVERAGKRGLVEQLGRERDGFPDAPECIPNARSNFGRAGRASGQAALGDIRSEKPRGQGRDASHGARQIA